MSIVVAGVVGPSIAAGYTLQQQRQRQTEAQRDELRSVIDFAVEQVGIARRRVEYIHKAWQEEDNPQSDAAQERITAWRDALEGPRLAVDRLAIRVAGYDPTRLLPLYEELLTALDNYRRVLQGFSRGENYESAARDVAAARNALLQARREFLSAAFKRVGIT